MTPAATPRTEVQAGQHYVVRDRHSRTSTVAFFDGTDWYLPGSATAFPRQSFETAEGRFEVNAHVPVPEGSVFGRWQASNGLRP